MRQTDHDDIPGLGKKIEPAPAPVPQPRNHNKDGSVVVDPNGKLRTNIPPPPLTVWEKFGIKKAQG